MTAETRIFTIYPQPHETMFNLPSDCAKVVAVTVNNRPRKAESHVDTEAHQFKIKRLVKRATTEYQRIIEITYLPRQESSKD